MISLHHRPTDRNIHLVEVPVTLSMTAASMVVPMAMLALTACFLENAAYRRRKAAQASVRG